MCFVVVLVDIDGEGSSVGVIVVIVDFGVEGEMAVFFVGVNCSGGSGADLILWEEETIFWVLLLPAGGSPKELVDDRFSWT